MAVSIAEMIYIAIELSGDYSLHANFVSLILKIRLTTSFVTMTTSTHITIECYYEI